MAYINDPEKFQEALNNPTLIKPLYRFGIVEWEGQYIIINNQTNKAFSFELNTYVSDKWYDIANHCMMTGVELAQFLLCNKKRLG